MRRCEVHQEGAGGGLQGGEEGRADNIRYNQMQNLAHERQGARCSAYMCQMKCTCGRCSACGVHLQSKLDQQMRMHKQLSEQSFQVRDAKKMRMMNALLGDTLQVRHAMAHSCPPSLGPVSPLLM